MGIDIATELELLTGHLTNGAKFYTKAGELKDKLVASFEKGKEPGEPCFIESLNDIFSIRPGFLYCFTGWPGSGKTEVVSQLSILQAHFKERKIAAYSPESYPMEEFIDTLCHCYLGKSVDLRYRNVCTLDEYVSAVDFVDKNFYMCDWENTPDIDTLLKSYQFLYDHQGVKIFIIDPFNSITSEQENGNIAIYLKNCLTKIKRFAYRNKAIMFVIEHPKTPVKGSENTIPGPHDLFGGTMWWNKSDCIVSVHRPPSEEKNSPDVIIKTWKMKNQKLNGRPGEKYLYFDVSTNRYYQDRSFNSHPMAYKPPNNFYEKNNDIF